MPCSCSGPQVTNVVRFLDFAEAGPVEWCSSYGGWTTEGSFLIRFKVCCLKGQTLRFAGAGRFLVVAIVLVAPSCACKSFFELQELQKNSFGTELRMNAQ